MRINGKMEKKIFEVVGKKHLDADMLTHMAKVIAVEENNFVAGPRL